MTKQVRSSSMGVIPAGDDGGGGGGGGTRGVEGDGSCGSTSPFSSADYAILQSHPQAHHSMGTNVMANVMNVSGMPVAQDDYPLQQPSHLPYPRYPPPPQLSSHPSSMDQPHLPVIQQSFHPPYHPQPMSQQQSMSQQQQQQQPDALHSSHLQSQGGPPPNGVAHSLTPHAPTASTPWTLGSTDGSYAVSMAMEQQLLEGTEVVNGPLPDLSVSTLGMATHASPPSPNPFNGHSNAHVSHAPPPPLHSLPALLAAQQSLYQDRLLRHTSPAVESVLAASCEVMGFDIAELWVRTGPKTHQLTNSHLRPTALDDSVRMQLVDVYYGEKSNERTHKLSPALCKRAKEAGDVVWVTAHSATGAQALRCSISNVRTAVAVPVCHEASNTNITILFFSVRRIIVRPTSVEFLVHMSLAAGVASVNALSVDGHEHARKDASPGAAAAAAPPRAHGISQSEHVPSSTAASATDALVAIRHPRVEKYSVTGAPLDLQWRQLTNVEYLTDGGNSWIHTAIFEGKEIVVKTLKPECQDVVLAINEIESELAVHSRLNHVNIVSLIGAGTTSKGVRFFVLERLDGGTLSQMLGYGTRIRDRRRRFWKKKRISFLDVLRIAKAIAEAMAYCHELAIPQSCVLHRDIKPDNIGFTLDGTVKILDFGLAKIVENASVDSDEVYAMSGETGSLRYMSPETASSEPYNYTTDVYSFGIILWELNALKKPFDGLSRDQFYERVVYGGERPPLSRKWPSELTSLLSECWDADMHNRPKFRDIVVRLDGLLEKEKGGADPGAKKPFLPKISGMIDRHSTWF